MIKTQWTLAALAFAVVVPASAHDPLVMDLSPRLIRYAPGKQKWMDADQISRLSEDAHRAGSCGGFIDVTDRPYFVEAAQLNETSFSVRGEIEPTLPDQVAAVMAGLSAARYEANIRHLQGYWNRYYTTQDAVDSALWIAEQFRAGAAGRPDITVQVYQHQGWPQPSIIAKIQGRNQALGEGIVLGAHEDSINTTVSRPDRPGARAPGADDNASGAMAVLEVYNAYVASGILPERDIYFMTYAAEEVGLRGSGDIAADFASRNVKIAAVMNLDMILYRGAASKMGVTTSNTDPRLTRFAERVIDRYVGAPRGRRGCGGYCSDHASWDLNGYPAVYLFETINGDISPWWHHPNDTINASHLISWGMNFVKAAAGFITELSLQVE